MLNFGYNIARDRQIDFDKNNRSIAAYVAKCEPSFNTCISCGTCASTCTAGHFSDISLQKIITYIRRGENEEATRMVAKCMLCGKCHLVCPRGVNTRNVIHAIHRGLQEQISNLQ